MRRVPPVSKAGLAALEQLQRDIRLRLRSKVIKINKEIIGPMTVAMVKENFDAGGRPKFTKNTKMTLFFKNLHGLIMMRPLMATGNFYRKVIQNPVIHADEEKVAVVPRNPTGAIKRSLWALHEGSRHSMTRTDKMRRFFWAMYYAAKKIGDLPMAKIFRGMAMTKKTTVNVVIPPRPWTKLLAAQYRKLYNKMDVEYQRALDTLLAPGVARIAQMEEQQRGHK